MSARVFAIVAHPDDIEFGMAGTVILLRNAGCEIHMMNIANGSCGTAELDPKEIAGIRLQEAKNAAEKVGAVFHPPLANDMEIFYEKSLLAKLASIVRSVAPDILLIPSPQDYMEDHMNTCRLAVTAAFSRSMKNFSVEPHVDPIEKEIVVYHGQPHSNKDPLNQPVYPDFFVDISSVIEEKASMLAEHKSQKEWLDHSQGMDAYLETMKDLSREMGTLSKQCEYGEGWRRHNPIGFCDAEADPLPDLLKDYVVG